MKKNTDAGSGPHDSENCSCRKRGQYWAAMCAAATIEYAALHAAAQLEYRNTVRIHNNPGQANTSIWD